MPGGRKAPAGQELDDLDRAPGQVDVDHDFPRLRQDIRSASDSAFAEFGDRFIVLPNPMYGSWERNTLP